MKKRALALLGVVSAFSPLSLFAQESEVPTVTVPEVVQVSNIQAELVDAIRPWVAAGLGVGIAVFCLYLGWRLIRRFTR